MKKSIAMAVCMFSLALTSTMNAEKDSKMEISASALLRQLGEKASSNKTIYAKITSNKDYMDDDGGVKRTSGPKVTEMWMNNSDNTFRSTAHGKGNKHIMVVNSDSAFRWSEKDGKLKRKVKKLPKGYFTPSEKTLNYSMGAFTYIAQVMTGYSALLNIYDISYDDKQKKIDNAVWFSLTVKESLSANDRELLGEGVKMKFAVNKDNGVIVAVIWAGKLGATFLDTTELKVDEKFDDTLFIIPEDK